MTIRWVVAAAAAFLPPHAASAQEPVEAAILEWVATVDATPEWSARLGSLTYDRASDTALVTDLELRAEPANLAMAGAVVTLATMSVAGYVEQPDGAFSVRSVSADGGELQAGFIRLSLRGLEFDSLSLEPMASISFNRQEPFTSLMAAYREALKIGLDHGRIARLELDQTFDAVTSKIVYENLRIDGFHDGRIDGFAAGPVSMDSPSPDGLIIARIGGFESRNTDLAAFVHVYDPASYVDGIGDMVWRDGVEFAAYDDIVLDVPGSRISIGRIVADDFRLRQPPVSFAGFLDRMMVYPDMEEDRAARLAKQYVPAMFSAFSVGRFAILDLSIDATGIDHFVMRDFHLNDLSVEGLGEFGIGGLEGVIQGLGAMRLGRFAFGDIKFGGYEALRQLIEAADAPAPPNVDALMPTIGFVEIAGLEVQTPDVPRISLERFHVTARDYVGLVPTGGTAELVDLAIPVSVIDDREARDILRRLGYDEIVLGFGAATSYDRASERFNLDEFRFGIKDMGVFSMAGTVGGLPFAAFTDERVLEMALPRLQLEGASFSFKDDSIVGRGLDLLADYMNAPAGLFRDQFADAMPFLLSIAVQNDPKLMAIVNKSGLFKQLTPAVRDFVANPGSSIAITVAPPTPVAFEEIGRAAEQAPETVAGMLGLTITAEKGALPPSPEAPPEEPGG